MAKKKKTGYDIRQEIVDRIVIAMENKDTPWQKPWINSGNAIPRNPVSGAYYSGMNWLLLTVDDRTRSDGRYLTFKQAKQAGYKVKKRAKGVRLLRPIDIKKKVEVKDSKTGDLKEDERHIKIWRHYTVFHASDIKGIPPQEEDKTLQERPMPDRMSMAEDVIRASKVPVYYGGNRACYIPSKDKILCPMPKQFNDTADLYGTLLHELTHSTGHKDRLNRDQTGSFGSKKYAIEELHAEMGSAMLCSQIGIPLGQSHIDQHSAYLKHWLKLAKDDPKTFFRAVSGAHKACEYTMKQYEEAKQTPYLKTKAKSEQGHKEGQKQLADNQNKPKPKTDNKHKPVATV